MSIMIKRSPTADTRSCDPKTVTRAKLFESSKLHIDDVHKALEVFQAILGQKARKHDEDKVSAEGFEAFYQGFHGGFEDKTWLDAHRCGCRHHLRDHEPENVDLLDVLEMIADCVVAGMARSGSFFPMDLSDDLLQRAVRNTADQLAAMVEVVD